ncbi:hypothetical protein SLE2022_032540 [Rubroshorea leprosula]
MRADLHRLMSSIAFLTFQAVLGFVRKTKLPCCKCGNYIGTAYESKTPPYSLVLDESDSSSGNEVSGYRKYDVRIRALQPSSSEEFGIPLFT